MKPQVTIATISRLLVERSLLHSTCYGGMQTRWFESRKRVSCISL